MTLKFWEGRKGTPISKLGSGKIVFPERGTTVELGKYYVGEIVFEKDNFAIFRPHRLTRKQRKYECGHEVLVEEGGEERKIIEYTICPKCHSELVAKYEHYELSPYLREKLNNYLLYNGDDDKLQEKLAVITSPETEEIISEFPEE
ncbi:hypothetical protein J7M00_04755 [bacterium]|nr:hypothetical protein [bacterium]